MKDIRTVSRYTWLTVGGGILALALAVLTFKPAKQTAPVGEAPAKAVPVSPAQTVRRTDPGHERTARARDAVKLKRGSKPEGASDATAPRGVRPEAAVAAKAEAKTASEKAVEAWDALIDAAAERTEPPTQEQAQGIKEALHKLSAEDQMDGIQNALNLLPDEQFPLLYPILFDKTENPDILDEIFSDALNRNEDIKVPMMKELYKDKEHPMFVESARILDATGELDEMEGEDEEEPMDEPEEAATPTP